MLPVMIGGALCVHLGFYDVRLLPLGFGVALISAGSWYRLTIGDDGIHVVFFDCWVLPLRRMRFGLDARVDLYESWGADASEGICIEPKWGGKGTDCFGPMTQARIAALFKGATDALEAARARVAGPPGPLRFDAPPGLEAAIRLDEATFWPSGRVNECHLARATDIGGTTLPAGTRLTLNCDGYLDPRSADHLVAAVISGPCVLPVPGLPPARAGARLWFNNDGEPDGVDKAFEVPVIAGAFVLHPAESISWDSGGRLSRFTLGAALSLTGVSLPAGTWISGRAGGEWSAYLPGPLQLPDLDLEEGDSVHIDAAVGRIVGAMTHREVIVRGVRLRGGIVPFLLDGTLRVDVEGCHRLGLVVR